MSAAGPVEPSRLAEYQAGAVVSRILLKTPEGSVTAFAFDKGEGLDEHSAPFEALVHVLEGEAEVTLSGTPHRLKAGQALHMPARAPHAVKAVERFKMLLTLFRAK